MQMILPFLFVLMTAAAPPVVAERASDDRTAALGQEFEIKIGENIWIANELLKIKFQSVAEDSRCPEGVACVWQGNGKVVLHVMKARRRPMVMMLNTTLKPKEALYRGYEVKLVRLDPQRKKNVRIRQRDYVATLIITRK